jgi:hypothetical protein
MDFDVANKSLQQKIGNKQFNGIDELNTLTADLTRLRAAQALDREIRSAAPVPTERKYVFTCSETDEGACAVDNLANIQAINTATGNLLTKEELLAEFKVREEYHLGMAQIEAGLQNDCYASGDLSGCEIHTKAAQAQLDAAIAYQPPYAKDWNDFTEAAYKASEAGAVHDKAKNPANDPPVAAPPAVFLRSLQPVQRRSRSIQIDKDFKVEGLGDDIAPSGIPDTVVLDSPTGKYPQPLVETKFEAPARIEAARVLALKGAQFPKL